VGAGAFMKRQVEARKLAQLMTTIARRHDLRGAGAADGHEPAPWLSRSATRWRVMEVSQTLLNAGPPDLTRLSLELAARMIFLAKLTETLEDAREVAQARLLDGSGFKKLRT
jgi:pyrimidine-nucleoside phosphorylase